MLKKLPILLLLLILLSPANAQQNVVVPKSKIIDAKQLLLDLKILSADDMEGRKPGTPGGARAREYILRRFKESGVKPLGGSYLQPFEFSSALKPNEKTGGVNLVGYVEGKQTPEKYIVVTAHYDHIGVVNGQIFNGSDDNASGTSALFAIAKYFKKNRPANSIILAAVNAEEGGLRGSKYFVDTPPVKLEQIVMNVNLDMISRDSNNILYAVGTYHYPFLKPFLEKIAATARIKLRLGHDDPNQKDVEDWTRDSDHYAFHRKKIPFIYFGDENYENHHKSTDDYETMIPEFYVGSVETVVAALKEFDANSAQIEKATTK